MITHGTRKVTKKPSVGQSKQLGRYPTHSYTLTIPKAHKQSNEVTYAISNNLMIIDLSGVISSEILSEHATSLFLRLSNLVLEKGRYSGDK